MRDKRIDLLRFIGLSLIILAHIQPPPYLFNIRCFDVPLMVFISGLTCYKKDIKFSWKYLSHRFYRLVFPVWIFLTIYFTPIVILNICGIDFGLKFKHIWGSYLLLDGIGYVWIIRVFLLIALITPILIKLNHRIKSNNIFILIYTISLCCFLVITHMHIGYKTNIVNNWLYYSIGYGFLFLLGIRIKDFTQKVRLSFLLLTTLVFAITATVTKHNNLWNDSILLHINDFKYPPTGIFLIYGIIASTLLYIYIYIERERERMFYNQFHRL